MALLKSGSKKKSWTGLGDVHVVAAWVVSFFPSFCFKTNQTSITQRKQLCIGHSAHTPIWKWVAWTSEEAMEPGKWWQGQQGTHTIFLAEEAEGKGGELGVYPTVCARWSLWAEIALTERRERKREEGSENWRNVCPALCPRVLARGSPMDPWIPHPHLRITYQAVVAPSTKHSSTNSAVILFFFYLNYRPC